MDVEGLDIVIALRAQTGMLAYPTHTKAVNGLISTKPEELAAQAGTDLESYSLARILASEGWGGPREQISLAMVAMGHAIVNEGRRRKRTVTQLATDPRHHLYGEQHLVGYASSVRDPTRWHIAVASMVLAGTVGNPIGSAYKFVDPAVWATGGMQSGRKLRPFSDVMREWHKDEVAWIGPVDGLDSFYLAFFRREPSAEARNSALRNLLVMYANRTARRDGGGGGGSGPRSLSPFLLWGLAFGLLGWLVWEKKGRRTWVSSQSLQAVA